MIGFVAVLILWEAGGPLGLDRRLAAVSSPSPDHHGGDRGLRDGVIWPHIGTSLSNGSSASPLAIVFAIPLGFAPRLVPAARISVDPLLSALYATPTVALVPLIILLFGVGLPSKFAVVFLEAWITLTVARSTAPVGRRRYLDIAETSGASRWPAFRSVTLPSSDPVHHHGLRIGAGRALVGVVVAEFIASNIGLGFYISLNGNR